MFAMRSKDARDRVQSRLNELGLSAAKTDRENQLLLTRWARLRDQRFAWLPKPDPGRQYEAERVRFEVFVSPFVEPARV
jgi:hypothetical protein